MSDIRVTGAGAYGELYTPDELRATQAGAYVELISKYVRVTTAGAYVEAYTPLILDVGETTILYPTSLSANLSEIQMGLRVGSNPITNLTSVASEFLPGLASAMITAAGPWDAAFDARMYTRLRGETWEPVAVALIQLDATEGVYYLWDRGKLVRYAVIAEPKDAIRWTGTWLVVGTARRGLAR